MQDFCECCGKKLKDPKKAIWLELCWENGKWYPIGSVDPDLSQGCFPLGPSCAKKLLKENK